MDDHIQRDIAAVRQIDAIPSILQVVCDVTGMGFAAVARVTESRWVACEVLDNIHFGLQPGGELPLETTICSEIRALREEVVIDHVAEDAVYASHHTPKMYGFQSYISVPIIMPMASSSVRCAPSIRSRARSGARPLSACFDCSLS